MLLLVQVIFEPRVLGAQREGKVEISLLRFNTKLNFALSATLSGADPPLTEK